MINVPTTIRIVPSHDHKADVDSLLSNWGGVASAPDSVLEYITDLERTEPANPVTFNSNRWAARYDFTGVSQWSDKNSHAATGVAISPRHLLHSEHINTNEGNEMAIGDTLSFWDSNGNRVDRIVDQVYSNDVSDVMVTHISADLPSGVCYYPVLGTDAMTWLEQIGYYKEFEVEDPVELVPHVHFDSYGRLHIYDFGYSGATDPYSVYEYQNASLPLRSDYTKLAYQEGDSGTPIFLILRGHLILTMLAGSCDIPSDRDEINTAMATVSNAVGATVYQLDNVRFRDKDRSGGLVMI